MLVSRSPVSRLCPWSAYSTVTVGRKAIAEERCFGVTDDLVGDCNFWAENSWQSCSNFSFSSAELFLKSLLVICRDFVWRRGVDVAALLLKNSLGRISVDLLPFMFGVKLPQQGRAENPVLVLSFVSS